MKKTESFQVTGLDRKWLYWVGWSGQVLEVTWDLMMRRKEP